MKHLDDQRIVASVLAGDMNAYSLLVREYEKPIFNLMYRMTGSYEDALDLAQETFIKAYEKLDSFRAGARFFPWLYTIGLNHARNFIRKANSVRFCAVEDCPEDVGVDNTIQQEETMCDGLLLKRLEEALRQIPFDYREAVILHYHEGFSMEDIARVLELSVSGAKMRVHRGIKKIREILFPERSVEG